MPRTYFRGSSGSLTYSPHCDHPLCERTGPTGVLPVLFFYDDEAARIGARSFTRSWRVKLAVLAVFVAAVIVGAGVGLLVR